MSKELVDGNCGVTILGRAGIRYREGSRIMAIDGEMLTGPFDLAVYTKSIGAWQDSESPISDKERSEIVAKLEAIFRKHGLTVDFVK